MLTSPPGSSLSAPDMFNDYAPVATPVTEGISSNETVRRVHAILPVKARGADLRNQYGITLLIGGIISLLVVLLLVRLPVRLESSYTALTVEQEVVHLEEITQTEQRAKAPPPPRPSVPIEVPNDEVVDDLELDLDVSLDLDEELVALELPVLPDAAPAGEEEYEAEIFLAVEDMPVLIGGVASIYENLTYPVIAREAGVSGTVVVQMVIEVDGKPTDIVVFKSVHQILDQAAVDAIKQVRFVPGKQRGKPVRVRMAIPVRFKIM